MAPKAPSEGTKVDLGQNAPIKNEPAGTVPSGSLADESYSEGGSFARNVGVHGENAPSGSVNLGGASSNTQSSSRSETRDESSSDNRNFAQQKSYAGAAPSYVENQYIRDQAGPHGSHITEGFDDAGTQDGLKKALEAEPGSVNDPARYAEHQMQLNNEAKSRAAGPREGGFTNETKYDALDSNASA